MSDANQGQDPVTEGQTEKPMPSSNKPEEIVEPQAEPEELTLPDGVKERATEQFEKLKAKNKELSEKLALHEASQQERPSFFNEPLPTPVQYQGLTQEQIDSQTHSLVDKEGYLDVESLNATLRTQNERVLRAEGEAKRARQEVERYNHKQEVTSTYKEFPELDPDNEGFDVRFYDMVTNEIYGQTMQGKRQDFLTAAKKVSDLYNPKDKKTQEASSKEAEREISKTKRVQASTPVGGGKGTAEPIDQEQLVTESRKGSMEAIYKRLQASGN